MQATGETWNQLFQILKEWNRILQGASVNLAVSSPNNTMRFDSLNFGCASAFGQYQTHVAERRGTTRITVEMYAKGGSGP